MVALRIYYNYMVQARKETHDHVSVRVKCLNYTCPNEFSVVGINKAILTGKPAPTRPIVKTRSLEQIGKLSLMILRVETTPKSSSIGGRFVYWDDLYHFISARL